MEYAAPELFLEQTLRYTEASDVYALGVVAVEGCTGFCGSASAFSHPEAVTVEAMQSWQLLPESLKGLLLRATA